MSADGRTVYTPPGPVADAFMQARDPIKIIMGPVGSGKTSAALMDLIVLARGQRPSPIDGKRRFKATVVRQDYRRLWQTTIPSWWHWVPQTAGTWRGSVGEPATHTLLFPGDVEMIVEFMALGDNDVESVMRGYGPTCYLLNELVLLAEDVLTHTYGRAGRYPAEMHGGPTWKGVLGVCNAVDTESWIYRLIYDEARAGVHLFRQPPAVTRQGGRWEPNPEAENRANLPAGYYADKIVGQPEWWVRRFLANELVAPRVGQPVYAEFNEVLHVAPGEIAPVPTLPLLVGLDAGLSPAAIVRQRAPNGQWLALDEHVPGVGVGPDRFADGLNRLLAERYPAWKSADIAVWADPSAFWGKDREDPDSKSWCDIVAARTGLVIRPAPTNNLSPRLAAVAATLARLIDGAAPGNLVSRRCRKLIRAYAGGYRLRKVTVAGEQRVREEPDKNEFSHIADADQYVILAGGEHDAVMGRRRDRAWSPVAALGGRTGRDGRLPRGGFARGGDR